MSTTADWSEWTPTQLGALLHLSFAMPVHEGYLKRRLKVNGHTLNSLIRAGLARRIFYREGDCTSVPFITLTQQGDAVRRDYVQWHQRVGAKIGSLPPQMAAVAEAGVT